MSLTSVGAQGQAVRPTPDDRSARRRAGSPKREEVPKAGGNDSLWTEQEVAKYLQVAPKTLRSWRWQSIGPRYYRLERRQVRYRRADVVAWVDRQAEEPRDNFPCAVRGFRASGAGDGRKATSSPRPLP
jgi:predicted DNA-binding transcriptional regulator AlpA